MLFYVLDVFEAVLCYVDVVKLCYLSVPFQAQEFAASFNSSEPDSRWAIEFNSSRQWRWWHGCTCGQCSQQRHTVHIASSFDHVYLFCFDFFDGDDWWRNPTLIVANVAYRVSHHVCEQLPYLCLRMAWTVLGNIQITGHQVPRWLYEWCGTRWQVESCGTYQWFVDTSPVMPKNGADQLFISIFWHWFSGHIVRPASVSSIQNYWSGDWSPISFVWDRFWVKPS